MSSLSPSPLYLQASAALRVHGAGLLTPALVPYLPRLAAAVIGHGC